MKWRSLIKHKEVLETMEEVKEDRQRSVVIQLDDSMYAKLTNIQKDIPLPLNAIVKLAIVEYIKANK